MKYVCILSCEFETKRSAPGNTARPSETTKVFSFPFIRTLFMLNIPSAPSNHPHGHSFSCLNIFPTDATCIAGLREGLQLSSFYLPVVRWYFPAFDIIM